MEQTVGNNTAINAIIGNMSRRVFASRRTTKTWRQAMGVDEDGEERKAIGFADLYDRALELPAAIKCQNYDKMGNARTNSFYITKYEKDMPHGHPDLTYYSGTDAYEVMNFKDLMLPTLDGFRAAGVDVMGNVSTTPEGDRFHGLFFFHPGNFEDVRDLGGRKQFFGLTVNASHDGSMGYIADAFSGDGICANGQMFGTLMEHLHIKHTGFRSKREYLLDQIQPMAERLVDAVNTKWPEFVEIRALPMKDHGLSKPEEIPAMLVGAGIFGPQDAIKVGASFDEYAEFSIGGETAQPVGNEKTIGNLMDAASYYNEHQRNVAQSTYLDTSQHIARILVKDDLGKWVEAGKKKISGFRQRTPAGPAPNGVAIGTVKKQAGGSHVIYSNPNDEPKKEETGDAPKDFSGAEWFTE